MIQGTYKGKCFICGVCCNTEEHHIFGGSSRAKSTYYGLTVNLCPSCHRGNYGVHGMHGDNFKEYLHQVGQEEFESKLIKYEGYTPKEARKIFIQEFIRSYL